MSQINESLVKNLVSVFAGVALANKLGKKFTGAGKPSAKSAQKIIDKDPELKRIVNPLRRRLMAGKCSLKSLPSKKQIKI